VKPVIAVLWILSIALAIGLTRLAGPDRTGSEPSPSFGSESSPSLDEAFAEFDPLQRTYLISYALQDFGPDDLPELMSVLVDRRRGIVSAEVRLFMLAWARFDAPGAYEWASQGPAGWRSTLTGEALFAWAYHDGPAAMAFVEEIEDPDRMAAMRQQAIDGWMRSDDKNSLAEYLSTFADIKRRGRFYFLLGGEVVMREGTEAAMRWVESLPDDAPNNLKGALFNVIAKAVANDDPVRAAEWFLAHRTRPYSKRVLAGIARKWVQNNRDAPAAFEWLLAMSSDGVRAGERDDAIAKGFRSWMQTRPEAAQEWLLSMLPNPELDLVIKEAIRRLMPTPDAAMPWARRLDDEAARHAESVRVGIRWRGMDPEAFGDWLKENDLPEETRQKILAAPQPPQPSQRGLRMIVEPQPAAAGKP
jgi:hypothetical protein